MAEATIREYTVCKIVIRGLFSLVKILFLLFYPTAAKPQVTKFSTMAHYFVGLICLWWKSYFTGLVVAVYFDNMQPHIFGEYLLFPASKIVDE